jgi:AcrR family transcriptional regulator
VAQVLEASGISRRTFYQFFESMAQVLDALLAIIASIWQADVRRALAETASRDTLVRVFVRAYRVGGFLLRALFAEAARPGSPLASRYTDMLEAITGEVVSALRQPASRRARTRAEIVAMLAVIQSSGIDPDSTAREAKAVSDLLARFFADDQD